jgi:hypothetical protein
VRSAGGSKVDGRRWWMALPRLSEDLFSGTVVSPVLGVWVCGAIRVGWVAVERKSEAVPVHGWKQQGMPSLLTGTGEHLGSALGKLGLGLGRFSRGPRARTILVRARRPRAETKSPRAILARSVYEGFRVSPSSRGPRAFSRVMGYRASGPVRFSRVIGLARGFSRGKWPRAFVLARLEFSRVLARGESFSRVSRAIHAKCSRASSRVFTSARGPGSRAIAGLARSSRRPRG